MAKASPWVKPDNHDPLGHLSDDERAVVEHKQKHIKKLREFWLEYDEKWKAYIKARETNNPIDAPIKISVKVTEVTSHDGIGTIEAMQETGGPHGPMFTIAFGEKTFENVTNALKGTENGNPEATTIKRPVTKIPGPAHVFAASLELQ